MNESSSGGYGTNDAIEKAGFPASDWSNNHHKLSTFDLMNKNLRSQMKYRGLMDTTELGIHGNAHPNPPPSKVKLHVCNVSFSYLQVDVF
jgi:hypothetical protein